MVSDSERRDVSGNERRDAGNGGRRPPTLVQDSATSAVWTLASRATGFIRLVLIGAVLGPTYFNNIFQLANQLPWIVFEFAVGAFLGALLVPALMPHITADDIGGAERLAGRFLGLVMAAFGGLTVLVVVLSPLLARLFTLGSDHHASTDTMTNASILLIVITAPQLLGYGIAVTGQAVQHAFGEFAVPAAASIAENVTLIAALGIYALTYGTGTPLADVGAGHLLLLGGGSTLGVALHAAIQWWGARRLGLRVRPRRDWSDPEVAAIIVQIRPTTIAAISNGARMLLLIVACNAVAGGVGAFQVGLAVLNLPVAFACKPVSYALLPRLAALGAGHDRARLADAYRSGVGLAALVAVPAAVAMAALGTFAGPIAAVGEMASGDGPRLISFAVVAMAGSVLGEGLIQIATPAAYSQGDATGATRITLLRLGITVIGVALAWLLLSGTWIVLGLGLAMSIADLVAASALHHRLGRRLARISSVGGYRLRDSLTSTVTASVTAFGTAGVLLSVVVALFSLDDFASSSLATALAVAAVVAYVGLRNRSDGEIAALRAELRPGADRASRSVTTR